MPPARTPIPPARKALETPTTRARDERDAEVTTWAIAAGLGDRRAAELFVHATYDDVRRFVAHLTADVRGADDLTQETYLRALTSLRGFAGRSCARSWLLAIARRVVVDRYRRAAARPRIAETTDWLGAADRAQPRHLPGFEESVALADALDALETGRRQAFVLTCLLGLSYAEAADALGCPVGTIRSRVARARRDLAEVWTEPTLTPAAASDASDAPENSNTSVASITSVASVASVASVGPTHPTAPSAAPRSGR
ncbi:sigma-70 family RNA polymerase sigma factor [Streptomyces sp. NPDC058001]|uniref:sigma-70 family RNA polymerase sigma factor n=1 Tax=Streptomyces sp. NPDC058001 TaxID=3346300 RepID=UPI0036F06CE4